jgi:photosystem II stability/assembly factor-like uncharacterized protein
MAQTWIKTGAPDLGWSAIASSADGNKLVATALGPIYTSTNAGVSWNLTTAPPSRWSSVGGSADGATWVAATFFDSGNPARIYRSTNSGMDWLELTNARGSSWAALASSADGSRLIAAEGLGTVYTSTNAGADWVSNNVPNEPWAAVATSADGTKLVAIAQANGIFISTNGGATWGKAAGIPDYYWKYLTFSADGSRLMVLSPDSLQGTLPGPMYMSTDSGATWTSNNVSSQAWLAVASSADGERLIATASLGGVFTSTDGGSTWISNNVPNADFSYLASSADGGRLATIDPSQGAILGWDSTPAPDLHISATNGLSFLSWVVPSTNFVLQQTPALFGQKWISMTNKPKLNLTTLRNELTMPSPKTNVFFRLAPQ